MMSVLPPNSESVAKMATDRSARRHFDNIAFRFLPHRGMLALLLPLLLSGATLRAGAQAPAGHTASSAPVPFLSAAHAAKLEPTLLAALMATAAHGNVSNALLPVIIQTDGNSPVASNALPARTAFRAFTSGHGQARALAAINQFGTLAARLTRRDIASLAADSHVRHISPDLPIQTCGTSSSAYLDYAMEAVGANFLGVNNNLSGAGVTVAVVDTGIYPHLDLTTTSGSRIIGWTDLVNNRTTPYDDNGHGTHVAGLVAGNGATAVQNNYLASLIRTAPSAQLVGVKVLDKNGSGTVSNMIAGIDWVVAHRTNLGIRVLNLSVGHPVGESYKTDPLCQACDRAWAAGITVVCAAGNAGRSVPSDPTSATQYGSITSPGNDPHVITVGAMNTLSTLGRGDDKICTYSSRGPSAVDLVLKPDLVAPGNGIISLASPDSTLFVQASVGLLDPLNYGGTGSKAYITLSGTSMASPIVAGAVALLLQSDPTLTPDTIKARLMLSATKTGNMEYLSYGSGYLNVVGALHLTQVTVASSLSPLVTRNADGTMAVAGFQWGGNVQGQNFGWGDNCLTTQNFGWGDNCLAPTTTSGFLTNQNFGWGDNCFAGADVFGLAQLPSGSVSGDGTLWSGGVAPLNFPSQTDGLSLMFDGD